MGLRLIKGRFLTAQDNETAPLTIVIDDAMARGLFPNEDPIGKSVIIPFPGLDQPRQIVGIVNHVKHAGLAADATALIKYQFYMPFDQIPDAFFGEITHGSLSLIVRTASGAGGVGSSVLQAVRDLDKDQPVFGLEPMSQLIEESVASQRFATMLLGIFGGDRADPGERGDLRRDVLSGDGTHSRDGHSHGAGCHAQRCDGAGFEIWVDAGDGGTCTGAGGGDWIDAIAGEFVVWGLRYRSADVCGGGRDAGWCGATGLLRSGEAGYASGSDGGTAVRMKK